MARLAGFEPTTPWFVAKYSIQLSYSRTREKDYNPVFVFGKPLSNFFAIFMGRGSKRPGREGQPASELFL
ncbi:conserved protein of unknown function [Cupriavidus neocaledonicus]|uniref:Uncharacterized protein n=1 Tax=Cupriavidus neocaledonicus TaxID=1040979 RepID=A0A375H685_9BURK|nr:hypothetical protein CBM2605_A60611 [Cupriavidus neocaledonicus]SPD45943.1 conserved protein of unknown function [Cupriavidus neocaledonicus]